MSRRQINPPDVATIDVTAFDLAAGQPRNPCLCPIALAAARRLGADRTPEGQPRLTAAREIIARIGGRWYCYRYLDQDAAEAFMATFDTRIAPAGYPRPTRLRVRRHPREIEGLE